MGPLRADGDHRLDVAVQDFFLPQLYRLTEQERALMTAMLHGLLERIGEELRARIDPLLAERCAAETADLVEELKASGLLRLPELVAVLLRRADIQRIAQGTANSRSQLQRWTASDDAGIASAAMALLTARGRGRDRFGRASLDLSDLPESLAESLTQRVAAALGRRCGPEGDRALSAAAVDLAALSPTGSRLDLLEAALAEALGTDGRRAGGLLVKLANDGEAPLIAAILAREAGIGGDDAWRGLLGGGDRVALLLRMAEVPRHEAAAFIANAGPALGLGDPITAIEIFERLGEDQVAASRENLRLPNDYRRAKGVLADHG